MRSFTMGANLSLLAPITRLSSDVITTSPDESANFEETRCSICSSVRGMMFTFTFFSSKYLSANNVVKLLGKSVYTVISPRTGAFDFSICSSR